MNVLRWIAVVLSLSLLATSSLARDEPKTRVGVVAWAELPKEAQQTLALIRKGGPFPYDRDGVVFGNFEKHLPSHERGYYHEYTVKTPGERSRGARRIIAGRAGEIFYTDDHYNSFKRIKE